jgi:hypothetical protein
MPDFPGAGFYPNWVFRAGFFRGPSAEPRETRAFPPRPFLYYSQPKKEIRLRHMKKQNPTRTVRYPVLHFEKEAAPVKVLKFLPSSLLLVASFQEAAFPF